jgi:hypothetical protein
MAITASELRQNVYRLLDEVLSTGRPLEIERNGQLLRISPALTTSRLERIAPRPDLIVGDPDDFVSWDRSANWRP